jgi:hypothetical protein
VTSAAADVASAAADGTATAPWTRAQVAALAVVTAGAVALRLFRIELWSWDAAEAETWRAVTRPWTGPDGFWSSADALAPLPWLGLRALLAAGMPDGEGWLRLPFAFAGVLAVPLLALAAQRPLGANGALLAAALLAVHPLHVAASQTAAPPVVAVTLVLGAAALAAAAAVRIAWVVLAAAALTAPIAWIAFAVPLLRRAPARVVGVVAVLAALGAARAVAPLTLPLVLLGTLALLAGTTLAALPAAGALVPLAAIVALAPWGGDGVLVAALLALPACLVLAVRGALLAHAAAAQRLRGSPLAVGFGAALPGALLGVWLATETALLLAIYGGGRTPWRYAAGVVWSAAGAPGELAVGAAAGAMPLTCYLQPNRWRDGDASGLAVVELDLREPAATLQAFAARSEAHLLLALREDEIERLEADAAARAALGAFAPLRVVATPVPRGLGSVHVYQRAR